MGRELRRVPEGWEHPVNAKGWPIPLFGGSYEDAAGEWDRGWELWQRGLRKDYGASEPIEIEPENRVGRYTEWAGPRPSPDDYMPTWPDELRNKYMMYENTSEGTPISPAFDTAEELARWLAETGASTLGSNNTATYDQWLATIQRGWAFSMEIGPKGIRSGVEALADE